MLISYAEDADLSYLRKDSHIKLKVLKSKIRAREVLIIKDLDKPFGWLRYGFLWDEIPFMNMLFLEEEYRMKGFGRKLVAFWEEEMKNNGFKIALTSSQSNEQAQHFYRKLGYTDAGSLLLPNEPLEILFKKRL
jgi:ribosomal protein S18 acetylase RimI-like enzyme